MAATRVGTALTGSAMVLAMAMAVGAPLLFPFQPYSRAFYDPWAGVGTIVAVVLATLVAFGHRGLGLPAAVAALAGGLLVGSWGDFNQARAGMSLILVGAIWLGGAGGRRWLAVVSMAVAWTMVLIHTQDGWQDALAGQPFLAGAPAGATLMAASWAQHATRCERHALPAWALVGLGAASVAALLLREYATPAENSMAAEQAISTGVVLTVAVLLPLFGFHRPTKRHLVDVLVFWSLLFFMGILVAPDPEFGYLMLALFFWVPLVPTALVAAGAGLRLLQQRGS